MTNAKTGCLKSTVRSDSGSANGIDIDWGGQLHARWPAAAAMTTAAFHSSQLKRRARVDAPVGDELVGQSFSRRSSETESNSISRCWAGTTLVGLIYWSHPEQQQRFDASCWPHLPIHTALLTTSHPDRQI